MNTKHTLAPIHPMQRINSMSTTGRITPRVLAGILSSSYVDEDTKQYIVRAVNSHDALVSLTDAIICGNTDIAELEKMALAIMHKIDPERYFEIPANGLEQ